jgi:hypothetical protein
MTPAESALVRDAIAMCAAFVDIGDSVLRRSDSEALIDALNAIRRVRERLEDLEKHVGRVH